MSYASIKSKGVTVLADSLQMASNISLPNPIHNHCIPTSRIPYATLYPRNQLVSLTT